MKNSLRTLVVAAAVALAACNGTESVDTGPQPQAPSDTPKTMPKKINPVPKAIMERLYEEVERDSGLSRDELVLERAQSATWGDGALGCPEPDVGYMQMIVHGYWVVLRAGREEFDFRIDHNQRHRRCTGATRHPPIDYPSDT